MSGRRLISLLRSLPVSGQLLYPLLLTAKLELVTPISAYCIAAAILPLARAWEEVDGSHPPC